MTWPLILALALAGWVLVSVPLALLIARALGELDEARKRDHGGGHYSKGAP